MNLRNRSWYKYADSYETTWHASSTIRTRSQHVLLNQLPHLCNCGRGFWETRGNVTLKRQGVPNGERPVISISKWEELGQYSQGEPSIGGFERVWDNRFPFFIFDGRDIRRPENRGYVHEECVVRHVSSWTNPVVHLELVQVLA